MNRPVIWSPELKSTVKDLYLDGKTYSQIGEITGVSRCSIAGVILRMREADECPRFSPKKKRKLQPLHKPLPKVTLSPLVIKAPTRRGTGHNMKTTHRAPLPPQLPESRPRASSDVPGATFWERTGCAWVVTDLPSPVGEEALYCDAPLDLPQSAWLGAYCEHHRNRMDKKRAEE